MPRNPRDLSDVPPSEGQATRSTCLRCQGTGYQVDLKVVWKKPREGQPPQACSRRVATREDAAELIVTLRAQGMHDLDCLSVADLCTCRSGKKRAPRAAADPVRIAPPALTQREKDRQRRAAEDYEELA